MARTVVVTGASAGVGRAIARRFAREGARLGLIARGAERLEAAKAEVEELGGQAVSISADVADADAIAAAADRFAEELGPPDVWVNNAMATLYAPVNETEPAEFRRATDVTYLGSVWGTMAALRHMLPRDQGTIVQVGSALAYRGIPLQAAYCGAKHALQGFLESLRTELRHAGSGIHVTMVHLPALNTPQFSWARTKLSREPQPVPPIFQPEIAAEAVYWASGARRREVLVGGPTLQTVLGAKFANGIVERYLAYKGVDAQLTDRPVRPDRRDNLFEPVEGDFAARGAFEDVKGSSLQFELDRRRGWILAGAGAALTAVAGILRAKG